jgi:outer membrane biogenesis lipoprotein LolB
MIKVAYLMTIFFSVLLYSCSINSGRNTSASAAKRTNIKEAQKIQKENYKNYTNSYAYKMQQEVDRRHKEELRRSKFAHKNKAQ